MLLDAVFICGLCADENRIVTMEKEDAPLDGTAQAVAVRRNSGIAAVQTGTPGHGLVKIPGVCADCLDLSARSSPGTTRSALPQAAPGSFLLTVEIVSEFLSIRKRAD